MAFLQGEPSRVSVTVIDHLKAIVIEPDMIISLVHRYPKFALEINSFIQARKKAVRNARGAEQLTSEGAEKQTKLGKLGARG